MKFKIAHGRASEFEAFVEERTKTIRKIPGLRQIYLLTPLASKEYRLVSWWDRLEDHEAWIRKESYEFSHQPKHEGIVLGTVPVEVLEVVKQW